MITNQTDTERILRIIIGTGITSLVFWGPESSWGYMGLYLLITGIIGVCPLYILFGYSIRLLFRD